MSRYPEIFLSINPIVSFFIIVDLIIGKKRANNQKGNELIVGLLSMLKTKKNSTNTPPAYIKKMRKLRKREMEVPTVNDTHHTQTIKFSIIE